MSSLFIYYKPKGMCAKVGDDLNKSWYHHIQVQQKYRLKNVNHFKWKHEIIFILENRVYFLMGSYSFFSFKVV